MCALWLRFLYRKYFGRDLKSGRKILAGSASFAGEESQAIHNVLHIKSKKPAV